MHYKQTKNNYMSHEQNFIYRGKLCFVKGAPFVLVRIFSRNIPVHLPQENQPEKISPTAASKNSNVLLTHFGMLSCNVVFYIVYALLSRSGFSNRNFSSFKASHVRHSSHRIGSWGRDRGWGGVSGVRGPGTPPFFPFKK